jgi:hypothetical protein
LTENENIGQKSPIVGRTVWDIAVASSYIMGGALFVLGLALFLYFYLDTVPAWFFIAIFGSLAFIPFLVDRAKEDADLFLVSSDALNLTEYRVGRKYGLDIQGNGVRFTSNSGTYRTLLTDFNEETRQGRGSSFGGYTQIDQVRDMNTLQNLSNLLEETLRETRVTHQTVGVEVEKQSKVIVDWALKTIYGSIIPTEISEIFGVEVEDKTDFHHETLEEIGGDLNDE